MLIRIENYKNAEFNDNTNNRINCEIDHPVYGWIPFTLDLNDTESTIDLNHLYEKIIADNNIAAYIPPTEEELLREATDAAKAERKRLLETFVDPVVSNPLRWADLTEEQQNDLKRYRQELLDITDQEGFPHDIIWPT